MVWSLGMGRMKAFARLLDDGSFTNNVSPDDARKKKLIAEDILGELAYANEPNLLDEKDMHVFGLKPMDDPLYLVSCNFCKKTINASQYASHTELCNYLGFQKAFVEVAEAEDGSVRKKTTRKRRNKISRYPHGTITGKQTRLESNKVDDSVGSKSYYDDHIGTVSSLSTLTDDSLDGIPKVDISSVNLGTEDISKSTDGHLKRCKLINARIMAKPDEQTSLDAKNDKESSRVASGGYGKPRITPLYHQKIIKFHNCSLTNDVPAPLATKIYYSQQSNHLRSALSLMFHKASEIRSSSTMLSSDAFEGNMTSPETCTISDELGKEFSDSKEHIHKPVVHGPAFGFQTVDDFRTTTSIAGPTANSLLRPQTASSLERLKEISEAM